MFQLFYEALSILSCVTGRNVCQVGPFACSKRVQLAEHEQQCFVCFAVA
jgi:hypothetical protein